MHGMIWYDWVLLLFQVLSVSDNATMHTMEIFLTSPKIKLVYVKITPTSIKSWSSSHNTSVEQRPKSMILHLSNL